MCCHCGTNRVTQWTFITWVGPGDQEEMAFPVWLAAPAMNASNRTKMYIQYNQLDVTLCNFLNDA